MNYTVARHPDAELNATAASCALSRLLAENHARDTVLQVEASQLVEARKAHALALELYEWWKHAVDTLPFFRPPSPLSPPPSPPQPLDEATTPVEAWEGYEAKVAALYEDVKRKQQVIDELVPLVTDCVSSRDVTCGRAAREAPDPWLATDGRPCRGNATKEAREEDYCGFWDSTLNLDAAAGEEYDDLYETGPHCKDEHGTVLVCPSTADRTARSGVYELQVPMTPSVAPRALTHTHTHTQSLPSPIRRGTGMVQAGPAVLRVGVLSCAGDEQPGGARRRGGLPRRAGRAQPDVPTRAVLAVHLAVHLPRRRGGGRRRLVHGAARRHRAAVLRLCVGHGPVDERAPRRGATRRLPARPREGVCRELRDLHDEPARPRRQGR